MFYLAKNCQKAVRHRFRVVIKRSPYTSSSLSLSLTHTHTLRLLYSLRVLQIMLSLPSNLNLRFHNNTFLSSPILPQRYYYSIYSFFFFYLKKKKKNYNVAFGCVEKLHENIGKKRQEM